MAKIWLIGATTAVLALMAAAVAVALVTTRGGVDLLPADSPEGVVQRYLLALEEEDYQEAYGYLSSDLRTACPLADFISRGYWPSARGNQVTLEETHHLDGLAVVEAEVTVFHHDAPFASEYSYTRTFELKLDEGQWRLTGPEWWCPPGF
jgi:hypothetical protein